MKTNGQTPSTAEQFAAMLAEADVDFEISEAGDMLRIFGDTGIGQCEGFILTMPIVLGGAEDEEPVDMTFCEVAFLVPGEHLDVSEERLPALYELMARINDAERVGAWEINGGADELRFRVYQSFLEGTLVPRPVLFAMIDDALGAIEHHWFMFDMVLTEGYDPAHAVGEFVAREALSDDHATGVEHQAFAMGAELLQLAGRRYADRGETDKAKLVADRLEELGRQAGDAMKQALN